MKILLKLAPILFPLHASCLFSAASPEVTVADLPDGIEHLQTLDGIEEYRLKSNDLRVLLHPNADQAVACVMVTYQVGSRNETTGTTGATHILEHMMFKGTNNYKRDEGADYSSQMERLGARTNATTYFDRTNYYAVLPSAYVPLAIRLEADRMRNLTISSDDLASEMTVVRNEYERGENNPVRTLIKEIYGTAFLAHPYGHPTIGWLSDIENTTPEKLRRLYDTYYWPENTYLSVIGGFDRRQILEVIQEHYGAIPRAPKELPQMDMVEPEQLGPRRLIIERAGQVGVIATAFKVPGGTHPDWAALCLLQQLLGADKTGRLFRALEDKGKASATFAFAPRLRDPGLFFLAAYMTPDATHAETESIMLEEITKVIQNGVTEDELKRAKSVIRTNTLYQRDGPFAIAGEINEAIAMGDWTDYVHLPSAIEQIEVKDIQRIAAKYLVSQRSTTGWFVPASNNRNRQNGSNPYGPNYLKEPQKSELEDPVSLFGDKNTEDPDSTRVTPLPATQFGKNMQTARIGDIRLVAIDMPVKETVSFIGSFSAGNRLSPSDQPALAHMTAVMLDKGTLRNDRFAMAERFQSIGAEVTFQTDSHALGFTGKFLNRDAGVVMSLLAEQLKEPAFSPETLAIQKKRETATLLRAMESTDYRADAALNRRLYPPDHPNYQQPLSTLIDSIRAITADDLRLFHKTHYGPASMLLVFAGDIRFEQLTAAVENAFSDWSGGSQYPATAPEPKPTVATTERIPMDDKASISVRQAYFTGLRRTDQDYLPFMVGNYILGGSFHSRLMDEIRQQKGLTYDIRSGHKGDTMTSGNWMLSASFAPSLLEQGLQATNQVLDKWYTEGVQEEEVQAATTTLSGSYLVRLSSTASVAAQVHSFIQRGLSPDYIDQYTARLNEIDAEAVNRSIRHYLQPEKIASVLCGSFSQNSEQAATESKMFPKSTLSVRLDVPDNNWKIEITQIYRKEDQLIILSQLKKKSSDAITHPTISTVSDSVSISELVGDPTVVHYITGKTWNWGEQENYHFIKSPDQLKDILMNTELIYPTAGK